MHRLLILSLVVLVVGPSPAQCCLGAQGLDVTDPTGRFRVEAISKDGVGHAVHGPYHYEFVSYVKGADGGLTVEVGRFEREWNTRDHFWMDVWVSPTGNGFVLRTGFDSTAELLAADGTVLASIGGEGRMIGLQEVRPDRLLAVMEEREDIEGRRWSTRRTRVFLPLLAVVGPETSRGPDGGEWAGVPRREWRFPPADEQALWLRRMLHWGPEVGRAQRAAVETALSTVCGDDPGTRIGGAERLLDLGLSACRPVDEALAADWPPHVRVVLRRVRERIRAMAGGHQHLPRDLPLLRALSQHPDELLAASARGRLRRILPEDSLPDSALRWDSAAARYVPR